MRGRKWRDWRMSERRKEWLEEMRAEGRAPKLLDDGRRAKLYMLGRRVTVERNGRKGKVGHPVFAIWCGGRVIRRSAIYQWVYRTYEMVEKMTNYEFKQFTRMEGIEDGGREA